MKNIAIWPSPWNYHLKNHMFAGGYGPSGAYLRAFQLWRHESVKAGFNLNTWDVIDLEYADVLWFIDIPRRKSEYTRAVRSAPKAVKVLMVCESPLICPQMFHPANRAHFDWVVSYEPPSTGAPQRFSYRLPVTLTTRYKSLPFESRKLLCMVNSNRVEGYFGVRQLGIEGLPGIGRAFNGWSLSLADLVAPCRADLYSVRRRVARTADLLQEYEIDFYGKGWMGEQISWCPSYSNRPYRCCRGNFVDDRLDTLANYRFCLAFENWRGELGYITDRIFDGLLTGIVPVYLGDNHISAVIPKDAYVDAREFPDFKQMLKHLHAMSATRWNEMVEAGRAFITSQAATEFSDETFAKTMVNVLKTVTC